MAGARAAASLSLTITVACTTLLVVGGILAGPSIIDCSRDTRHLGACLHGKLEQGGILPAPAPIPVQRPIVPSEAPPPVIAEAPHRAGWIEANATEYEGSPAAAVELSAMPGIMDAAGLAPSAMDVAAHVALVAPGGTVETAGAMASGSAPSADAVLSTTRGLLEAGGGPAGALAPSAEVALAEPAGKLLAGGDAFRSSPTAEAVVSPIPDRLIGSGSVGNSSSLAGTAEPLAVTPPAAMLPLPDTIGEASGGATDTAIAALLAELAPPLPASRPAATPHAKPPHAKPRPVITAPPPPNKPIIKFDRRYPDVVVLPPPNSGKASSFSTLQLR